MYGFGLQAHRGIEAPSSIAGTSLRYKQLFAEEKKRTEALEAKKLKNHGGQHPRNDVRQPVYR